MKMTWRRVATNNNDTYPVRIIQSVTAFTSEMSTLNMIARRARLPIRLFLGFGKTYLLAPCAN